MGTLYRDNIYVFHGQKKYVDDRKMIQDEILGVCIVYKDGAWR